MNSSVSVSTGYDAAEQDAAMLHQKLHALEAVRAREMQVHGEQVRHLESQLESRRRNEKELELVVAKLRAEKCCLEGESTATSKRLKVLEDEATSVCQRHDRAVDDFRQRLLGKEEEITALKRLVEDLKLERAQSNVEDAKRQAESDAHAAEVQRLKQERSQSQQQVDTLREESGQLRAQLQAAHSAQSSVRDKMDELHLQVKQATALVSERDTRIHQLTAELERVRVSRARLAAWKHNRFASQAQFIELQAIFLEWRAAALVSKASRTHEAHQAVTTRLRQLDRVYNKLMSQLLTTRRSMDDGKAWLQAKQVEFQGWQQEITVQLVPQIMSRVKESESIMMRASNQEKRLLQEQLDDARRIYDQERAATAQLIADKQSRFRCRVDALVAQLDRLRQLQLRAQAFQGWKDVYLRNVVAETTHAVMVARAAQVATVMATSSPRCTSNSHTQAGIMTAKATSQSREPTLTIDTTAYAQSEQQQWERWRRVTPTAAQEVVKARQSSSSHSTPTSTGRSAVGPTRSSSTAYSSSSHRRASVT